MPWHRIGAIEDSGEQQRRQAADLSDEAALAHLPGEFGVILQLLLPHHGLGEGTAAQDLVLAGTVLGRVAARGLVEVLE
jgi:hypothetical protein